MYPVKVRTGDKADEELAAAGVWPCVCHRESPSAVWVVAGVGLTVDLPVRTACPCEGRVAGRAGVGAAALCHKAGDHTVELEVVVEALIGEMCEVGDSIGSLFVVELDPDVAFVCFDLCIVIGFHHILWDIIAF